MDMPQEDSEKDSFRAKIDQEKQKFWEVEGGKTPGSSESDVPRNQRQAKKSQKGTNILLFLVTFAITVVVTAYFLINFAGK